MNQLMSLDIYQAIEKTQANIMFFEAKNGKKTLRNRELNGSKLALWEYGQVFLQNQLRAKRSKLIEVLN